MGLRDLDPGRLGAPDQPHRHHRTRSVLAVVAATAGALAVLILGLVLVSGSGPSESPLAWVLLPVLLVIWLTGFWWRWDSPDRRRRTDERGRRGY